MISVTSNWLNGLKINLSLCVMNELKYNSVSSKGLYSTSIYNLMELSWSKFYGVSSYVIKKFLQNRNEFTSHFSMREFDIQCFSLTLSVLGI